MKCDELKHQLMLNKEMSWVPCYLKSEADSVIDELKEKNREYKAREDVLVTDNRALLDKVKNLENLLRENAEHFKRNEAQILENADKVIVHQKRKRCLAMGHRCQNTQYHFQVLQDNEASKINSNPKTFKDLNRKYNFYARWRTRWFMIADKLTEQKFKEA